MRYNEPFNEDNNMTEDEFESVVLEAIGYFEKINASRYLPKFLRDVFNEMVLVEKRRAKGFYGLEDSSYDIASSNLNLFSGTYKVFFEQAETQIEVMLRNSRQ